MLDSFFLKFPAPPEKAAPVYPAGWTLVAGAPQVRAARDYLADDGSAYAGFWECTPGTFEVIYDKWEFCHMMTGRCVITPEGKAPIELRAGDGFILEPGFKGRWEVVETMSKHFVFRVVAAA